MSAKDKWVRRFSVDETSKHKNGFTIYKITSVLFPIDSPEVLTIISVWKRYSDVQRLHKSMRSLHAGLHLRGTFPTLTRYSYFKRFQQEVIAERAKTIKTLLEFIADHKLLFTSTDFVNFLQTGYPEPEPSGGGVINAIRSSLHLPIEETPPLEYHTSDDDSRSPAHSTQPQNQSREEPDLSRIPIYKAADVEQRASPQPSNQISQADSFESLTSLESNADDFYRELDKLKMETKSKPSVKKTVLPDLINFDTPSTSFEDHHTMPSNSETISLNSTIDSSYYDDRQVNSRVSSYKSSHSLSNVECKAKTEDSYVFEAGYMLNLAARYEDMGEFQRAFECYKAGIEKMLIGVQTDSDPQRRALIKEKTNKYLSYAEAIYKDHLCDAEQSLLPDRCSNTASVAARARHPVPLSMLSRPYEDLAQYRVLAVLGHSVMLVLNGAEQTCYAMKVIQKVPNNLTEFDEYFLQNTNETRQPVLPTLIPYMVSLHSYIQTNNLIFLILSYAPGEKLFDYIKNYAKSLPSTPSREVNLENVFSEPKVKKTDIENDNIDSIIEIKPLNIEGRTIFDQTYRLDETTSIIDRIEENIENNNKESKTETLENTDISVKELVKNSQKLLLNVEKALSDEPKDGEGKENEEEVVNIGETIAEKVERRMQTPPVNNRRSPREREVLPPSAVCRWGAEILTALESLHNAGVVCRDLNPSNILLGERGQVILTYFTYYPGLDMCLRQVRAAPREGMHIAPEVHARVCLPHPGETEEMEKVCDFWSFGAVMYELICGVPLSQCHRGLFTSHTLLQLPDGLPLEAHSLLTQLLTYEPSSRLGAGREGIEEIKRHPYFKHIDWQEVYDSWVPG